MWGYLSGNENIYEKDIADNSEHNQYGNHNIAENIFCSGKSFFIPSDIAVNMTEISHTEKRQQTKYHTI